MTQPSSVIGLELPIDSLVVTRGRDFRCAFQLTDDDDVPVPFPPGELFFELAVGDTKTRWEFDIDIPGFGSLATLKVESEDVEEIVQAVLAKTAKVSWQLVWLPDGESAGGDAKARGKVVVQQ